MKVSSMLVISVTTKLPGKIILKDTLSQNMKILGMLVISVTTKLLSNIILKLIFSQNMSCE